MYLLNRSAVVVRARQPYFDWANSLGSRNVTAEPADRRGYSGLYLVPPFDDDEASERLLRKHFRHIFENELAAWTADHMSWPQHRTYAVFLEWFEIEFLDSVHDDGGFDMQGVPV